MKTKTILALSVAGAVTTALGASITFLGTYGWSEHQGQSSLEREVGDMVATEYFSSNYRAARDRFLDAARTAGAKVESLRNPHPGPDGEPLFSDVALLGPDEARTVLVVSCGTHGVEGFAGSGIQTGLLQEGIASRLPAGVRLVMIHAINPYGMAHLRRFTEENVDLNRNFRDHAVPARPNPGYERLATAIAPESLGFWSEVSAWARLLTFRVTAGAAAAQRALQSGQYSHPTGLFYGGHSEAWANQAVRSIVQRFLSGATNVVVIDVHTGLGAYGDAELIMNVPPTDAAYGRAVSMWGNDAVRSTIGDQSVSKHLDASLKLAFAEMLPHAQVTAASLEFGTLPPMAVFKALRAENWLHHHGGQDHPRATEIKRRLLRAFHPDDAAWEDRVWTVGTRIVHQALAWLGEGAESHGLDMRR